MLHEIEASVHTALTMPAQTAQFYQWL
jgi:hypothetical protein